MIETADCRLSRLQSTITIWNPQSQSAIYNHNLQSSNPQSAIKQSAIINPHSAILLVFKLHHRDAAAALIVGSGREVGDVGVCSQKLPNRATELASAVPMNDSHRFQLTQHRFVDKFLDSRDGFVRVRADDVQLGERTVAGLQVHVDADS